MKPKDYRNEFGLTPDKMAKLLGVHPMTWRKWESGERKPGASTMRLMEFLNWLDAKYPDVFGDFLIEAFSDPQST